MNVEKKSKNVDFEISIFSSQQNILKKMEAFFREKNSVYKSNLMFLIGAK